MSSDEGAGPAIKYREVSSRRLAALCLAGAFLSAGGYLGTALLTGGEPGYPLDDSWIHQTIARNLALRGEWSINPGEPAAVSTAPFWTALIVPGYLLGIGLPWTLVLGILCSAWNSWETTRLAQTLFPHSPGWLALLAGVVVVFEWHLAWAALSGMETLLFTALSLATLRTSILPAMPQGGAAGSPTQPVTSHAAAPTRALVAGLLAGLLGATRPEGILLGALLGVALLARRRLVAMMVLVGAMALASIPVALLNFLVEGSVLPSAFYAKHAAYAADTSPLAFVAAAVIELARGPVLLLYPGLVYLLAIALAGFRHPSSVKNPGPVGPHPNPLPEGEGIFKSISLLAAIIPVHRWRRGARAGTSLPLRLIASSPHHPIAIWVLALILAYAWWLPAVYHHGRYLIPVIPILVLYGLEGGRLLLARLSFRVLPGIAGAAVFVVLAFSWLRGAQVYTQNVAYVNDHHVALARWLAANTSETGLVATHDIGAVGYLAGRRLVDIAGLATPELQASTRDVRRVKQVLSERMVEHVAILPDWYPPLTDSLIADPAYTVVAPPGAGGFLVLERLR